MALNRTSAVARLALGGALLAALLLTGGCGTTPGRDDLSTEPETAGERQIEPDPGIGMVAEAVVEAQPWRQAEAIASHVLYQFRYDPWHNTEGLTRSASTLFDSGYLVDCADYAVAATALLRAADIPARLVLSANHEWIVARRKHPLLIPRGHVFVEVRTDGAWRLLDVPNLSLKNDYDPAKPVLPNNERYCLRVADFWQAGIDSVAKLNAALNQCADTLPDE